MGSVHVGELKMTSCDFSSSSEGLVRSLISSFASLRGLKMNACSLMPAQYTNELLVDCARRPELTSAYFNVGLPFNCSAMDLEAAANDHDGPLDEGILALLFREAGVGVDITFVSARHFDAIISDEFSKRLLEVS